MTILTTVQKAQSSEQVSICIIYVPVLSGFCQQGDATPKPLGSILPAHHAEQTRSYHVPNSVSKVDAAML